MPLPLAHGGKHVSSKPITCTTDGNHLPREEDDEDGKPLQPVLVYQGTAMAVSDVLSATVTSSIYHLMTTTITTKTTSSKEDEVAAAVVVKTTACIQIQVSPGAEAFSGNYRQSFYQVDLEQCPYDDLFAPPTAMFASKFLACIVASQVIIFQLRKPLPGKVPVSTTPPLPSYITRKETGTGTATVQHQQQFTLTIPVATNPHRVSNLTGVLSICNMQTTEDSLLLAGLEDGGIVVVSYRDSLFAGSLFKGVASISQLSHISMGKRGRLVALDPDGNLSFFESHALIGTEAETEQIVVEAEHHQSEQEVEERHDEDDGTFYNDESDSFSKLQRSSKQMSDLIRISSTRTNMVLVNLIPLPKVKVKGQYVAVRWIDEHFLVLLDKPSTSAVVAQVVAIQHNTSIELVSNLTTTPEQLAETAQGSFSVEAAQATRYSIDYHPKSGCLLISSHLVPDQTAVLPFCCCWHWRSNTTSLVISSSVRVSRESRYLSRMFLSTSLTGLTKLVHVCTSQGARLRKSIYQTAIVSPNNVRTNAAGIQETRPLVLGETSVTFPVCYKSCALHQTELEWRSASLPPSYLSSCGGAPLLASVAYQDCRAIAVAATLGLCILDASRSRLSRNIPPKWRRFDKAEEIAFQVLAMQWWEGATSDKEDYLLTVVETGAKKLRYLSCWSRKKLALSDQMLVDIDSAAPSAWGVKLPPHFNPSSLSLLANNQGRAVAMITDCSETALIFQLQRSDNNAAKCSLALHGGMNPNIKHVFLASASFSFDLEDSARRTDGRDHVAVIGIIAAHNVQASIATRRALLVEEEVLSGTVTKMMLSDKLDSRFVWTMELSDGSAWCWSTPTLQNPSSKPLKTKMPIRLPTQVGAGDYAQYFGTISRVGDSAMWLLGSKDTQQQLAVGCMPSSKYGCIMKGGQEGINHHQLIPGDFSHLLEHEVFSFGKASITTPAYLTSLLNHLLIPPPKDGDANHEVLSADLHYLQYLQPVQCGDTSSVALRMLVLRSVEMMAASKKNKADYKLANTLYSNIIELLMETLSPNAFASLLLSLARQVEPSCMEHLFPLPDSSPSLQTIEDLYVESVRRGSLATPSLTLPLLSTKLSALEECKEILYHCLLNLSSSFSESHVHFDTSREERQFVRDLFRFANQLEQMDDAEFWSDTKLDVHIMPTAEEKKQGKILSTPTKTPSNKTTSGFSILTPLICSGRRRREERAVYEAASTFIGSGFEEFEYEHIDVSISERVEPVSVMFITGKLLARLSLEEKHGWKKAALMARLILGDTSINESGKGVVIWVQSISLSSLGVTAHRLSKSKDYLDLTNHDEVADVVSDYLVQGMFAANHEMTRSDAAWLLELVILSLSRLSPREAVNQHLAPCLVLMATIVGHVSGRMEDMVRDVKKKDRNALMSCYEEAKRSLASI